MTTYEITMNDIHFLKRFDFKSLIIDEGHRLKNCKCKLLKCLREVSAESKVLLTGSFQKPPPWENLFRNSIAKLFKRVVEYFEFYSTRHLYSIRSFRRMVRFFSCWSKRRPASKLSIYACRKGSAF